MKIPLNFGGGGGSGSDDCTATASDVLESKTAIYNGSDDEPEYGTMKDYSGTTNTASAITSNASNSRIELTVPNTGKYDTSSKIYYAYSSLASTIGLTAAKIATGNTILGIAGTYTGLGSATQAQVLSGKTFSTASLSNATGTMTDKSGTTTAATSSVSGSNYRLLIPTTGYYNTSAYLTNSYSNTASTIGLTSAKLKSGESVLGISGSWSGYVGVTTDIYNAGVVNSSYGSITISSVSDALEVTAESSYIKIRGSGYMNSGGFYLSKAISCGKFNKVTIEYEVVTSNSSTRNTMNFALSYGSNYAQFRSGSAQTLGYEADIDLTSTKTGSVTIDITDISEAMYVGAYAYHYTGTFEVHVTHIYVS